MTTTSRGAQSRHDEMLERAARAARLLATGMTMPEIAARMGVDHSTVRRWLKVGHAD